MYIYKHYFICLCWKLTSVQHLVGFNAKLKYTQLNDIMKYLKNKPKDVNAAFLSCSSFFIWYCWFKFGWIRKKDKMQISLWPNEVEHIQKVFLHSKQLKTVLEMTARHLTGFLFIKMWMKICKEQKSIVKFLLAQFILN